jgi:hypothetical protein
MSGIYPFSARPQADLCLEARFVRGIGRSWGKMAHAKREHRLGMTQRIWKISQTWTLGMTLGFCLCFNVELSH